jgi:hypothetical protein
VYWYFVVGLIAAALMPYEIYFYSSGAVEEGWDPSDMKVNRANAFVGFGLGGLISVGILVASAQVFKPAGISPTSVGSVALIAQQPYAELGLILALVGMLFAVGGATVDTAMSAAYNLAQHQGWKWGKRFKLLEEPRFTLSLAGFLLAGFAIVQTGVDPVELTEYAVIFSIPVLPLTYLPILLVGNDRAVMGEYVNGPLARVMGWLYFAIIFQADDHLVFGNPLTGSHSRDAPSSSASNRTSRARLRERQRDRELAARRLASGKSPALDSPEIGHGSRIGARLQVAACGVSNASSPYSWFLPDRGRRNMSPRGRAATQRQSGRGDLALRGQAASRIHRPRADESAHYDQH